MPVFEKPGPNELAKAPKFIEKLQPKHVPDGYSCTFECKVEGIPRPQITWFRQTAIIKPSNEFQMYYNEENVATLIIREVYPEDAGKFTCVAKNAFGFASSTAELTVDLASSDDAEPSYSLSVSRRSMSRESSMADILEGIPPIFSRKPKAQYVKEHSNVVMECRLVAVPEPEIIWYYNGKEIEPKDNVSVVTESDMHMYCTVLHIKDVLKDQEGKYEVVARNREGESVLAITLKVKTSEHEAPEILEPLQPIIVREGESTVLTTQIVGSPSPKIEWFKDGKPVKENTKSDKDVHTLTLISPKPSYSGVYTVKATNPLGSVETTASVLVEEFLEGKPEPPMFKQRFEELIVPQNGVIRLAARVTGNPVPEISWLKNNKPMKPSDRVKQTYDGENIELIIFTADSELDTGVYKVEATNPVGTTTHGARVTVDVEAVCFTKKLKKNITVEEGRTLTLECETSHTVSTRWYHDDQELTGMDKKVIVQEGKTHKLIIKNPNVNDSGPYSCRVKDQVTESTVTVLEATPEFLRKLQDIEVKEGQQAILEVEITSESADVTWYKDGEKVPDDKDRVIFVKKGKMRKLIIRSASVHDEGEYTCVLADQECTADLSVIELPPEIITKMTDQTIAKGETAVFEVELTKGDALVQWFKNGQDLILSDHVELTINGKRQILTIHDATLDDDAEYTCIVGNQESTARLTVEEPIVKIVKRLPDVTLVTRSSDATFTVELSQDVPVKWFKNDKEIEPSTKNTIISDKCTRILIVHDTKETDADEYSCTVFNVKTSSKLKVETIKMPPTIIIDDKDREYKVKEGEDVTFTVKYSATPKPEAEWSVAKTVIKKTPTKTYKVDEDSASLTIKKVQEVDAGDYTIKLKNECGEAEASLTLIIMKAPSAPGTPEPVEITDNSVTLFWKLPQSDGNAKITEYYLEYQLRKETKWTKITEKITETTYKVTKLTKNSEYTFRVTAVNEVGPSPPSPQSEYIKIVAPAKKEPPTITEPLKDVTVGPGQSVTLTCVISGNPTPTIKWFRNKKVVTTTKTITYENRIAKYVIDEANEESVGTYTCTAENVSGKAETSCTVTIQEKPSVTVDEKLITQTKRVHSDYEITATIRGYPTPEVIWTKDDVVIKSSKTTTIERTTTSSTIKISSLERSDSGRYIVEAKNSAGSNKVELQLKVIDKPSKPEGPILIREVSHEAVEIEWKPPTDDGGLEISQYTIEKCDPYQKAWIKVAVVDKSIDSFCIQKLLEDAQYLFRVMALNPVGTSEPLESDPVTLTKMLEKPSPPQGPINVTGMGETSFTLLWQPPLSDGGSKIIDYVVEIKENKKKVWRQAGNTVGNTTSLLIENLVKNEAYDFRIMARNKIGTSLPLMSDESIVAGKKKSKHYFLHIFIEIFF